MIRHYYICSGNCIPAFGYPWKCHWSPIKTLLQFMFIFIGFSSQKIPKSDKHKKKTPCQYKQVILAMSSALG